MDGESHRQQVERLLQSVTEGRPLGADERDVLEHILRNELITDVPDDFEDGPTTVGQRLADHVAAFGGSWLFISAFFTFILLWMLTNVLLLAGHAFDPYPFILLNLILSCLAAVQAPIIMMSQNRQEEKDRQRARADYRVNLKAEVEIRLLHEKIDALQRLLQEQRQ
ncbi:MAG: DUF1003 domain-containing protein [Candidatus Kapabacteria bacterium]|nr:DUF1003 domain-containing protein [Candidatus Kapabacteria bacterium]